MLKIFLHLFALAACVAAAPPTPPIRCGETPANIFSCLGNPKIVEGSRQCEKHVSECERIKCVFNAQGWLDGDQVKKQKVLSHFDTFASEHPVWAAAVKEVKEGCLATDLPPQGVYTECPPYDIMECALTAFIRKATRQQWSPSQACEQARQFAGACPVCPADCFAPLIPGGSCRACALLPRAT